MTRSAMGMTDSQAVCRGEGFFVVEGEYERDSGGIERIACSFGNGSKALKRNGKEYERLSEHIGLIPIAVVSPSDAFLVSDAAEERRRYVNGFLSQIDADYLRSLIRYNHLIGERNKLLKALQYGGGDILEVIDMQLAAEGDAIYRRRTELVGELSPLTEHYYRILSDDSESVSLSYRSELSEAAMAEVLAVSRAKDEAVGFTTSGIHRDDFVFGIGGYPLKKFGSQGQQKSFLVALKLAQYSVLKRGRGERPLLLLDDIFDKLDLMRVERFVCLIASDDFGQAFITDCNRQRITQILERCGCPYTMFKVAAGGVKRL
jgi:DNA replication and repair protein RecF